MANTFEFVGKISQIKDSEKFHPIEQKAFNSGWENYTVRFNCISDTNRVMIMAQGGRWKDVSKNGPIKTVSKDVYDDNGNRTKGEKIEIQYAKRFDADQIDRVAAFRRWDVNLGSAEDYTSCKTLVRAFENDTVTDDMIEQSGCDSLEKAKAALEKINNKRKLFLTEYDFCEYLAKLVQSDKYKDSLFKIKGNYDVSYNADKKQFYTNYHVNSVALANKDAVSETTMKIDFFFGNNAWDDSVYENTGKIILNGWVQYYDANLKKNGFKDFAVIVRETNEERLNALSRKFNCEDDEIKQIGLTLSVIEGAQRIELTEDMLSDEEREDLKYGLVDWDDLKKAYGNTLIGDRLSELRFATLTAKKSVSQDTIYHNEDMRPAVMAVVENIDNDIDVLDDDDDIFDIDDEL